MEIVKRLCEILPYDSERSAAIEFGSTIEVFDGNSLYDYEIHCWKVICIQENQSKYDHLRILRRLCLNVDCVSHNGISLDQALSRINIEDIRILLIKNTQNVLRVLKGFSLERRNTKLICIEQPEQDSDAVTSYLSSRGFKFQERFLVSNIYLRDEDFVPIEESFENIFEI
jgi:hypothetical protein